MCSGLVMLVCPAAGSRFGAIRFLIQLMKAQQAGFVAGDCVGCAKTPWFARIIGTCILCCTRCSSIRRRAEVSAPWGRRAGTLGDSGSCVGYDIFISWSRHAPSRDLRGLWSALGAPELKLVPYEVPTEHRPLLFDNNHQPDTQQAQKDYGVRESQCIAKITCPGCFTKQIGLNPLLFPPFLAHCLEEWSLSRFWIRSGSRNPSELNEPALLPHVSWKPLAKGNPLFYLVKNVSRMLGEVH